MSLTKYDKNITYNAVSVIRNILVVFCVISNVLVIFSQRLLFLKRFKGQCFGRKGREFE